MVDQLIEAIRIVEVIQGEGLLGVKLRELLSGEVNQDEADFFVAIDHRIEEGDLLDEGVIKVKEDQVGIHELLSVLQYILAFLSTLIFTFQIFITITEIMRIQVFLTGLPGNDCLKHTVKHGCVIITEEHLTPLLL